MLRVVALAAFVAASVSGDLYMHAPRGSNGRLNGNGANRDNANRLFDTQNNAKGGYCVGAVMSYYEGSMISIEWTNQHGCGKNPKLYCNMVVQYMCGNTDETDGLLQVRDGTDSSRIPDTEAGAQTKDATLTDEYQYGMHESYQFYQDCKARDRNYGIWASDRPITQTNLPATRTRQNNNGNRNGFECVEERDYYPYWHPTPWRDVAVMTHDMSWCQFYQTESENVKPRGHCVDINGKGVKENQEATCAAPNEWVVGWSFGHPLTDESVNGKKLPAPDCVLARWSRDNHLGNGLNGFANSYNWTLPTREQEPCIADDNCNCVLRLRYNISTTDLDYGTHDGVATKDSDMTEVGEKNSGNRPGPEVLLDWTKNGVNSPIHTDPNVKFDDLTVRLAIDTTQFGRTFQDRTHVFHILKRPDGVSQAARIYNLGVRGKRGNIVQTYPSVEYDFTPQNLHVRSGDFVHFQWTGCDTNPAGNAGEGRNSWDRSNIVQIGADNDQHQGFSRPVSDAWMGQNPDGVMFPEKELRQFMAYGDQDPATCADYATLLANNGNNAGQAAQDPENCLVLNKMSQYFNAGLIQMNHTGEFFYMSSRNNNFSNRGQKGSLKVETLLPIWAIVLVAIGAFFAVGSAGVAGSMFYAKSHPHSGIANLMNRMN